MGLHFKLSIHCATCQHKANGSLSWFGLTKSVWIGNAGFSLDQSYETKQKRTNTTFQNLSRVTLLPLSFCSFSFKKSQLLKVKCLEGTCASLHEKPVHFGDCHKGPYLVFAFTHRPMGEFVSMCWL